MRWTRNVDEIWGEHWQDDPRDIKHAIVTDVAAAYSEGASVAYLSRVLGHANPAITLSTYAHEFARAEHADRTRKRMEAAFGLIIYPSHSARERG